MKILIVGNSQVACLKKAHDIDPNILEKHGEIFFYVTPGGMGPFFTINDDLLVVQSNKINPNFPPRAYPEKTPIIPLSYYDIVVISALGLIQPGFSHPTPTTQQGLLYEYDPKEYTNRFLSKACYGRIINSLLFSHPGIQFLLQLRKSFDKKIIVQPFPLLANFIRNHTEWPLNKMYNDPLAVHKYFTTARDCFLANLCKENEVELLPYPCEEWRKDFFTPDQFMRTSDVMRTNDGIHPNESYGKIILEQLSLVISNYQLQ